MTTFGTTIMIMFIHVSTRVQTELALLPNLMFGPMPSDPKERCEFANAFETPISFFVDNAVGFARKYSPALIVIGIVLMAIGIHRFRKGSGLVGFIVGILGAFLLLGLVLNHMELLNMGMAASKC